MNTWYGIIYVIYWRL